MLRNEKFIGNDGKVSKGIHLESFIYNNAINFQVNLSTSGLTESDPLYIYIYSNIANSFQKRTTNFSNNTFTLSDSVTNTKYFLTYGNNDAVRRLNILQSNTNGDIKGLLNYYTNLEQLEVNGSLFSANFNDFQWPRNMKSIHWVTNSIISGNMGTFVNLDNLEYLYLVNVNFSGDISKYNKLNYLYLYFNSHPNNLTGNIANWSFINNLTYLYMAFTNALTGSLTNWSFNNDLTNLTLSINSNTNITGDISNWDFSNTKLTTLNITYRTTGANKIIGNLSNWSLPSTLVSFYFQLLNITHIPTNYSNTNLSTLVISSCPDLVSNLNDIILRSGMTNFTLQSCPLFQGNINTYTFPSSLTVLQIQGNNIITGDVISLNYLTNINNFSFATMTGVTGNLSGLTFWSGLTTYSLFNCSNIIGNFSSSVNIPNSLTTIDLRGTKAVLDLSSTFDFKNVFSLILDSTSGITGSFSNFIIDNMVTLSMAAIPFNNDLSELNINYSKIRTINIYSNNSNYSDISNWFPTGTTISLSQLRLDITNITANVSNWYLGTWFSNSSYLFLSSTNLYGDLSNNNTVLPFYFEINNSNISGDIGKFNYVTRNNQYFRASSSNIYGNFSGVTLNFSFYDYTIRYCTGVTNIEYFMNYLFINRKNWINPFTVDIRNVGETLSGTYQLGDLGTYGGHQWDLTEAQINNLVDGLDYNGQGTNTPWTTLQKYYYQKEARLSSSSTQAKYRINNINYSTS